WQLALVALVTIPVSALVVSQIAKRSQPQFVEQWKRTGTVNAHVEEMYTGHDLVTVFGHQERAVATFREENEKLFQASFKAQFITGTIQPVMGWVANIGYVAIAVLGAVRITSGEMMLGDVLEVGHYFWTHTSPALQV